MKIRTFLTLMLVILTLMSKAQDNVNIKEMVGFACSYDGQPTKTVVKMTKLLKKKKYKKVSSLLTSKNTGEKYLAVISLQRLSENGIYPLSDLEKTLIMKAKSSDELVSVCSGCVYFDKVPMKKIVGIETMIGSSYWLDVTIKTN